MTTKYIQEQITEFKKRKNGIVNNTEIWNGLPVGIEDIDAYIKELEESDQKISDALTVAQQEREKARALVSARKKDLEQIDNFAMGLHKDSTEKLIQYGIKTMGSGKVTTYPHKTVIQSIVDDFDGEGFIIQIAPGNRANYYEVERGTVDDVSTQILAPPYPFLRTTKKLKFVDDNVVKGVRYFYRARAINTMGPGEWSEPISRVQ